MRNNTFAMICAPASRLLMVCVLIFGVAGCGEASGGDGAQTFSESRLESPCDVVSPALLGKQFDIPADEIEQTPLHIMGALCSSEWEGDDKTMTVEMRLQIFEKVERAASRFKNSTRSVTQEEMAAAVKTLKEQSDSDPEASEAGKMASKGSLAAIAQQSTTFEDVAEMGDEARFNSQDGKLVIRVGNLIININAYYGETMPLPDELTANAIIKANKAWMEKTMSTRKQQTIAVARAIVAAL